MFPANLTRAEARRRAELLATTAYAVEVDLTGAEVAEPDRQFTSAGEILPFGAGTHHCTGSRLAQTELVHAFGKLASRVGAMEPAVPELPRAEGFVLRSPPELPVVLRPASPLREVLRAETGARILPDERTTGRASEAWPRRRDFTSVE